MRIFYDSCIGAGIFKYVKTSKKQLVICKCFTYFDNINSFIKYELLKHHSNILNSLVKTNSRENTSKKIKIIQ